MTEQPHGRAGGAYLVRPDAGNGPGVLVLSSWWGLNRFVKDLCERLADQGFTAMAPDLMGGVVADIAAEAEVELAESDPNATAGLLLSSVVALRSQSHDPDAPVSVIGFSMGASWAMWLATRQPDSIRRVVIYYGTQNIDFADLEAPVLGHFAEHDSLVSEDEVFEMQAHLLLDDHDVEFHRYPGTQHWFAEENQPDFYDAEAADLAWLRTLEFLRRD